MKILYTPTLSVPALGAEQRARILEAAGPAAVLVEARDLAHQRAEVADADVLFGRVPPDVFACQRRLRYYHALGAERGNAQGGRVEDLHQRRSVAAIGPWGAGGKVDAR
jgi:hypothetical protein